MVMRESLIVSLAGVALGPPLAALATRVLQSMLFDVSPGDPLSFSIALVGVAFVVTAAGVVPARRASDVDPMVALRYD